MKAIDARALLLIVTVGLWPCSVDAQTIPVRTVPVASGDQFLMLPSATLGMGGVRLALDDSLSDGWTNPAKGSLVTESAFIASPTYYGIGERQGAGRSFPVAGVFKGSAWFGGAALAIQQIDNGEDNVWGGFDVCCFGCCGGGQRTLSATLGNNLYASGYVGRPLGDDWTIGFGAFGARIGAMEGVDLLYAGARSIDQSGSMADLRVGLFRDGERDRLSLIALHNRVSMEHDVAYVDWVWDEDLMQGVQTRREELNEDQTRTWGAQFGWDRALDTPGWRIGASGTLNYKDHPKIPNYEIQNIPRDPGTTWAYEGAFGFSRTDELTRYALDVAFQPIWSDTWQVANAEDVADSEQRLAVGDRSIENDFFFTNVVLRSGLSQEIRSVQAQLGIEIRSYSYHLEQVDHVRDSYREQDESWIEWSPSIGALFRFEALELRYLGRVTTGTGRPGVDVGFDRAFGPGEQLLGDVILAPEGALTLQDAKVTTHQLSVRIPVR